VRRAPLLRVLGTLGLVLAMLARVLRAPLSALPGFPNIDLWDTVMLRGVVADLLTHPATVPDSPAIFFPTGYPVLQLTPNLLDHLTGAPLAWALPFPLSDSLWWLLVLLADGLAAHRLGRRLGGSEGAGWLATVAVLLSEPLAREANLHHAPQAMIFWAPLLVLTLLDLRERPSARLAVAAGAILALGSLSYWYLGLFLGLGCMPLLWSIPARYLSMFGTTTAALAAPALAPLLLSWGHIPLTAGAQAPPAMDLPAGLSALGSKEAFVAWHGNDPLFWLRRTPMDTSNRISLVVLLAAVLGARRSPRGQRRAFTWMVGLGAVMLLGPVLLWRGELVTVAGHPVILPFQWLRDLHPFLARLTWPERWGVLVSLGLACLAARAPRPGTLALLAAVESFALSANLPLQATDLRSQTCQAALAPRSSADRGAILELPLKRPGLLATRPGVHRRLSRRLMVNAILLPPGATPPADWLRWQQDQPLLQAIAALEEGHWPADPGAAAVEQLRQAGVAAIVLDTDPGAVQTRGGLNRHRAGLIRLLGPPVDLGCALVWWLSTEAPAPVGLTDGDTWREQAWQWKQSHPQTIPETLIQPTRERGGW